MDDRFGHFPMQDREGAVVLQQNSRKGKAGGLEEHLRDAVEPDVSRPVFSGDCHVNRRDPGQEEVQWQVRLEQLLQLLTCSRA